MLIRVVRHSSCDVLMLASQRCSEVRDGKWNEINTQFPKVPVVWELRWKGGQRSLLWSLVSKITHFNPKHVKQSTFPINVLIFQSCGNVPMFSQLSIVSKEIEVAVNSQVEWKENQRQKEQAHEEKPWLCPIHIWQTVRHLTHNKRIIRQRPCLLDARKALF